MRVMARHDRFAVPLAMICRILPFAIVGLLSACTSQQVAEQKPAPPAPQLTIVEAVPSDARCRAVGKDRRRDAQPAPLTVDPRLLGFPVEITCEAPGYFPTTETLHPRPIPDLLTALARREMISPMADPEPAAGAPADSAVHFRITVALRGRLFETAAARDAFYEALKLDRETRWTGLQHRADAECSDPRTPRAGASANSPPEFCRRAYSWLREQRDADLRRLEIDRRRATFR